MADIQLSVRDLRKTFDPGLFEASVEVLKGLSFEVGRGEIFGFLGPNGAGKTTTIKAITEIIYPDTGKIMVCGLPHTSLEAKRRIGFMSESPYVYRHLTGREYLRFAGELLGLDRSSLADRISRVLDQVGMMGRADRTMGTYSKGMLQRVALGQALLGEPELLILDEPMSGLDPVGRRDVRDIILTQAAAGVTVFFSTHIIPDVEMICDRVAIVVDGRVEAIGAVSELVSDEATSFEATFVGAVPSDLRTPLEAHHVASGASWVRVASENHDRLIQELNDRGAKVMSLDPVRATLEDLLMRHYEETGS
ncbi:MAG: ABC transporter ATP-binding protein [Thermoanaerobaculales bacterium]|nr:ABC transporter ATP-binding protein [Thermoanaerobaculales bacterium]